MFRLLSAEQAGRTAAQHGLQQPGDSKIAQAALALLFDSPSAELCVSEHYASLSDTVPATASRIHEEFDFLLERGYVLAAESNADMAGTIAYRSPLLWLSFDWDRGEPCLSFTVTSIGPHTFFWTTVDYILNGATHPEYRRNTVPEAPIAQLEAFVRANLDELERRLSSADRPETEARFRALPDNARREMDDLVRNRRFR